MTAFARSWRFALTTVGILALITGCLNWRSEITVVNRTTQDVLVRFGFRFESAVLVHACGELAFDPGVRHDVESPPPDAVELEYHFGGPPDAPNRGTYTITSEGVRTYVPSPPPCEGLAPSPTPGPTGRLDRVAESQTLNPGVKT